MVEYQGEKTKIGSVEGRGQVDWLERFEGEAR